MSENRPSYKIGIDVGGTFTDLVLWTEGEGTETFKVLSTPEDPSIGVLEGISLMARSRNLAPSEFAAATRLIVHGTTVCTNAVLTRGGATVGLLTTDGVRDTLEMRRGVREEQYNNRCRNVVPLVPRRRRRPVAGRLDFAGRELQPLDLEAVRVAAEAFAAEGVTAVAVCFMHAYADGAHERAAADVLREALPGAYLSVSSEILPTIRFYDRVSTTVLNAYVGPVLRDYLRRLTDELEATGFRGVLLVMQSNGGLAVPEVVLERPATTLLSGPAGGPRAAATFAAVHNRSDCILIDMGGTSFEASLVRGGAAAMISEGEIARLRIALPMLDITTIGAGGGSIGWLDEGGLLRMGPESAGAAPGPACYGRGGECPTCTDADLVLGYLDPAFFAGGRMPLDVDRAAEAIRRHVAEPLGLGVEEAAAGMYRVINANMAGGVRQVTVRRGLDPREFPLVVAGGAGALHATQIAAELEIPSLLVPAAASTLCAVGMLQCDLQHDFVRSCVGPLAGIDTARLLEHVRAMVAEGAEQLAAEGAEDVVHEAALDLRYLKQYHEVTVPVDLADLERGDLAVLAEAFHAAHNQLYGYDLSAEGTGLELINVRLRARGRTESPPLSALAQAGADPAAALKGRRRAYVPERAGFAEVPVYDGHALAAGHEIPGPALVERVDTTLFVGAAWEAKVDRCGTILLRRRGADTEGAT